MVFSEDQQSRIVNRESEFVKSRYALRLRVWVRLNRALDIPRTTRD